MYRIAIPIPRKAIPVPQINEDRNPSPRPKYKADHALEVYFAVLTILILGMTIGLAAYAVHTVIPEWQKLHSPSSLDPRSVEFESHSAERR